MLAELAEEVPGLRTRYNRARGFWEISFRFPDTNTPVFGFGFATHEDAISYALERLGLEEREKEKAEAEKKHRASVIEIWTDGSNRGQPGPGGWGAVLICGDYYKELSGRLRRVTNNQAEVQAVIEGLKAVTRPQHIEIVTDSQYVEKGINRWIHTWAAHGWKKPNKNRDQWQELHNLIQLHKSVKARWVKGHSGLKHNERADELAGHRSREEKESQNQ